MWMLFLCGALAAEPSLAFQDDGWLVGHVDIAASPDAVWALVADPGQVARFDAGRETTSEPDGTCHKVTMTIRHPLASPTFHTRSCPDGERTVRQVLTGGDMAAFDAEWRVEARGDGTRLHHRWKGEPASYAPQWIVHRMALKGATKLMAALRDHLEAQP